MTRPMCKKTLKKLTKVKAKEAHYECSCCKATAHKEKHLCKPRKLPE